MNHENILYNSGADFFDSVPGRISFQMLLGLYARTRATDDHTRFLANT